MAIQNGTEAYDLSLFETKPAKVVDLKPNKKLQKAKQQKMVMQSILNTAATLCVAAVVVSVLGLMITSRVRMTELDTVINTKEEDLVVLQSEKIRLMDELASKTSTEEVEEYAENVLGMQKVESSQIIYISAESGDKVEMADAGNASIIETIGSAITKFFKQLVYLFE